MSNDPLDETIRGGHAAKLRIDSHDIPVWLRPDMPADMILIEARHTIHPQTLAGLERLGFGVCYIKSSDGKHDRYSVSVVAPAQPQASERPGPEVMYERAKAMSNELFGEGNLIIDDFDAIQNSTEFREAYRRTLYGQAEELREIVRAIGQALWNDLKDMRRIIAKVFGVK